MNAKPSIAEEFDAKAESYEHNRLANWYIAQLEILTRHLGPIEGDLVDVGCGTGYLVRSLARTYPNARFVGIDLSAKMVQTARGASRGLDNVAFLNEDWETFDLSRLATRQVSQVTCTSALHYFVSPQQALARMYALLQPGGRDEFVFLAVGNPRPEKAFEDLIAASVELHQQGTAKPFAVLIIGTLGDNEYCRNLQRLADNAKVPGLRLLGFRSDVQRFYSAADVLVVSSRSEGLPMVVLEAMTAGLPILSTRVGGIPDAVAADCGRLVQPASPEELASGMATFLQMEPQERLAMGLAAFQHATQRFGVETMTTGYIALFSDLLRPARSASSAPRSAAEPA